MSIFTACTGQRTVKFQLSTCQLSTVAQLTVDSLLASAGSDNEHLLFTNLNSFLKYSILNKKTLRII
jgi:hypothetical protein